MQLNNLSHPTMQAKLFAAMSRARVASLNTGKSVTYVKNRNGWPVMRVEHKRGINGGFKFCRGNKDLKAIVLQSLRSK